MKGEVQLGQSDSSLLDMKSSRAGVYEVALPTTESEQSIHLRLSHESAGQIRYTITCSPRLADENRALGLDEPALLAIAEIGKGLCSRDPAAIAAACAAPPPADREKRLLLPAAVSCP